MVILQTGSTTFMAPPGTRARRETGAGASASGVAHAQREAAQELILTQFRSLPQAGRADENDAGDAHTFYALNVPAGANRLHGARQFQIAVPAAPFSGRADRAQRFLNVD